jgi:endonuclease-3
MVKKHHAEILDVLGKLYPEPKSELEFSNPFQLIVSVILSAQCTDKKVNEVTKELFTKFSDFSSLKKAKLSDIARIIRPVNYFKTKAANIIKMATQVVEEFKGEIPLEFEKITSLAGVGRKTANVVLGELGADFTLPVDTHVFRVSRRLGLSKGKTPEAVEMDLRKHFAPSTWRALHHRLIFHGRRVCAARNPKCEDCALAKLCPSKKKTGQRNRKKTT